MLHSCLYSKLTPPPRRKLNYSLVKFIDTALGSNGDSEHEANLILYYLYRIVYVVSNIIFVTSPLYRNLLESLIRSSR